MREGLPRLDALLEGLLERGSLVIGEVTVRRLAKDHFVMHHTGADPAQMSNRLTDPASARFVARTDTTGAYRPLKSAPNLARDWVLELRSVADVRRALDRLYPAAIGLYAAKSRGELAPTPFAETAARQSGMYRVVAHAPEELVDQVCSAMCASQGGCLRTILWEISPGKRPSGHPQTKFDPAVDQRTGRLATGGFIPLLCAEACNLFVGECRSAQKKLRGKPNQAH